MSDGERIRPGFGDVMRRQAAQMAELAADYRDDERTLRDIAERVRTHPLLTPGFTDHLAEMLRIQHDGVELLQGIAAAQAIAFDEMIAAGGPDNPEAYDQYRQTTERLVALMPRFGADD